MTDLRLFNAIEEQQKQQEIQQSSLMQKATEQVQQRQELSPEIQGIIDRVQQQNERDAIRRRLDNFYTEAAQYASGGGIHIDPSKKGTFTAAASRHGMGVQEFASHVHAHPENYSPAMRKKAAFARAASKWKHAFGGSLNTFDYGGPTTSDILSGIESTFNEKVGDTPSYDYTYSEQWANEHGYYPDERGHRDDRVKYDTHPTHPSKGTFIGNEYHFTDKGMEDVNHTLWGLRDNGDGNVVPVYNNTFLLPELTVTPYGSSIHNTYDNINYFGRGGTLSHQDGMIKSILDKYLSNYRITSGYRGPNNKVGKLGSKSAHARLLDDGSSAALDIVADDMNKLRAELANPALQRELAAAGFGILDETDPVTMKKTGATGAHFHIGQGIKGGGFHLNRYGYQPGYASANYPARGGALQPIVTGSGTDDSGFTPWWTRNTMTDADMESLYASAAGSAPEPEAMDFSQFNLDWSPNTASYPNLFAKGGFTSSPAIRSQIAAWEGSSMYKPAPDTGKVNRPFSAEERDFWNAIPDDVKPYLTQEMADALFSTSYNIGAGNFKKRVVPKLRSVLVNHQGTVEDITNAMYGTRDSEPKMKGLRTRRAAERQMFTDAYNRAYGEGGTGSYAGTGYGYGEPIIMSQNESQQEQFTPWWQQPAMTDEDLEALYSSAAGQVPDATPDFTQFNLGWDPVRGRHDSSSFPRLFSDGGLLNDEDLIGTGWYWGNANDAHFTDPLYKTIRNEDGTYKDEKYLFDESGRLVPKSVALSYADNRTHLPAVTHTFDAEDALAIKNAKKLWGNNRFFAYSSMPYMTEPSRSINKLDTLFQKSSYPTLATNPFMTGLQKEIYGKSMVMPNDGRMRAHVQDPFGITYIEPTPDHFFHDYISELAHTYVDNNNEPEFRNGILYGIDAHTLPNDQYDTTGYDDHRYHESRAHHLVQPSINWYLMTPDATYGDFVNKLSKRAKFY